MDKEKINEDVRKDLFKKIGTIFMVFIFMVTPTVLFRDLIFKDKKNDDENSIIYKDGYIIEIKDKEKKTLWESKTKSNMEVKKDGLENKNN